MTSWVNFWYLWQNLEFFGQIEKKVMGPYCPPPPRKRFQKKPTSGRVNRCFRYLTCSLRKILSKFYVNVVWRSDILTGEVLRWLKKYCKHIAKNERLSRRFIKFLWEITSDPLTSHIILYYMWRQCSDHIWFSNQKNKTTKLNEPPSSFREVGNGLSLGTVQ